MNASLSFKRNTRILLTAIVITILLTATSALAASGTLDSTFGTNGIVTTQFNNLPSSASEVLLQTDGKIIILGTIKLSDGQFKKIIARYKSNGTLDTLFGDNGKILIEIASFSGSKIALQPDGKLIVGGLSGGKIAVVRYNSNGTQDTTFGTNGMGNVRFFSEARQSLADMMIQFDGKIVMVGDHTLGQSNFTDLFIARFNSNGTPDETFVANGFNIIDDTYFPNNRYNYGKAGFIQPDGKIIILGNMMDNDGKNQLSMARINQDGSLDTSTFGTNGKGTATFAFTNFQSYNMTVQTDGKIIVLAAKDGNVALVRCNSNGTLDTSFGGTGIMTTDFGGEEQTDDLVIQSDGKIIIEGKTSGLYSSDFLLVRYNRDGSLDTTFGANGKVITDFGSSDDAATGI